MTICPICMKSLEETDTLVMKWYELRKWFVLEHHKDGIDYAWCVQANHPICRPATLAVRDLESAEHPAEFWKVNG